jgi:hypothetical protein
MIMQQMPFRQMTLQLLPSLHLIRTFTADFGICWGLHKSWLAPEGIIINFCAESAVWLKIAMHSARRLVKILNSYNAGCDSCRYISFHSSLSRRLFPRSIRTATYLSFLRCLDRCPAIIAMTQHNFQTLRFQLASRLQLCSSPLNCLATISKFPSIQFLFLDRVGIERRIGVRHSWQVGH